MYTDYFGLQKRPFVLSPDPEFLFLSRGHDLALTHLEYGLLHNVGFVALTGEVGAGKTTLLKHLLNKSTDALNIAMLFNTLLDPHGLLETILREFEIKPASGGKSDLVDALHQYFLNQYTKGNRCVIIVDEAQNLPLETFEELRMLSNLEVSSDFLVQIVLVGQPQLRDRLSHPSLAQLKQRISVHYHLAPLSPDEVGDYIRHRLEVADYTGAEQLFEEEAIRVIAEVSQGIPRMVNSVADTAMIYAFGDDAARISGEMVAKVVSDNQFLLTESQQRDGNGNGNGNSHLPESFDVQGTVSTARNDTVDLRAALSNLAARLETLEMRVHAAESGKDDRAVQVLQEMLAQERTQNLEYAKKISIIARKYNGLLTQLENLRKREKDAEDNATKSHRSWRLFGGRKT